MSKELEEIRIRFAKIHDANKNKIKELFKNIKYRSNPSFSTLYDKEHVKTFCPQFKNKE